jgi:hypothetical protein
MKAMTTMVFVLPLVVYFLSIRAEESVITRSIEADQLFLKVVGTFDPRQDDVYFISVVQTSFDDYCQRNIADLIYGFDIALDFILAKTLYEFNATNDSTTITSWCEIWATFSVSKDLDPSKFSIDSATQFVKDFFADQQSNKIMNRLEKRQNISVSSIDVFDASSEIVKATLKDSLNKPSDSTTESTKGDSRLLEVMAGISCGVIAFALSALLLSTFQRRYHNKTKNENGRLGIKRQASADTNTHSQNIILNPNRELDQRNSEHDDESDNECNDPVILNENNEAKAIEPPIVSSGSFGIESFDDSDENIDLATNQVSPSSQYNSTNGSSPVWSISVSDNTVSPYSTEEVAERRRWHDNVDGDLNHLSLPGPFSSGSSTNDTSNIIFESDSISSNSSEAHNVLHKN